MIIANIPYSRFLSVLERYGVGCSVGGLLGAMVRVGGTSKGGLRMTVAKAGVCTQTLSIPSFAVALSSSVMLK